jgi:hypothetical protein
MSFILCTACHRHVSVNDPACPFCKETMPTALRLPMAVALVAGLGLACSACYGPPRYQLRDMSSQAAGASDGNQHVDAGPAGDHSRR